MYVLFSRLCLLDYALLRVSSNIDFFPHQRRFIVCIFFLQQSEANLYYVTCILLQTEVRLKKNPVKRDESAFNLHVLNHMLKIKRFNVPAVCVV